MGLLQQIQNGAVFTRQTTAITNTPVSGSTSVFGSTYILLNVTVNNPCRIRLYSDSASVAIDNTRTTASMDFSASVGLVLDTFIENSSYTLNFDPPIIGTTYSGSQTWYNISGSSINATFTYYPIESTYAVREKLEFYAQSLPVTGSAQFGNINSPKSFLILSASSNFSGARLRLYSRDVNTVPSFEIGRSFGTEPSDGSYIITDMIFDSASYAYKLSPILQAYNLTSYTQGSNFVGYILENAANVAGAMSNVTASLYIYSIED